MKSVAGKVAVGLIAILLIAALLLTLGQRETQARPSANSYNPSGLHALKELLERNDIETVVDRLDQPRLRKTDLILAAYVESGPDIFERKPLEAIENSLKKHVENGGRVLVLPFDDDFRARSFTAIKQFAKIETADGETVMKVSFAPSTYASLSGSVAGVTSGSATFMPIEYTDPAYIAWYLTGDAASPYVAMSSRGEGILCRTTDGLFASNRFIDRGDNAKFALRVIRGLLPEGGRVVFTEASLGEGVSASLATVLGPWASGVWAQAIFFFVVVVVTLGIRFGLPDPARRRQAGQREMIDAISHVYERAKSSAVAVGVAHDAADRRIRRALKLPAHLGAQDRDRNIPASLAKLLSDADLARKPIIEVNSKGRQKITYRLNSTDALDLIRRLESELDQFIPQAKNRIS
jgi:hypothetical protein